ncbi:hypothetical protein DUI87_21242 [Hirundo rustica rustica]|uniref:Uncharacterized protein n=1 Tax=Hirundo rustica rustica TaxID=333673 RepID=A0A3M0JTL6_HIRRU|nr:hypothetical protein DUI87_21242 [Hirundo rustica rustica]
MHTILSKPWTFPSLPRTTQPKQGIKLFSAEDGTGEGALHSKTSNGAVRSTQEPLVPLSKCKHTTLLSWTALDQEAKTLWPFNTCQDINVVTMVTHQASSMELQATSSLCSKPSPNNTSTPQRASRQGHLSIVDNTPTNKRQNGQGTWKTLWAQTNKESNRDASYLDNLHVKHPIPLSRPLLLH